MKKKIGQWFEWVTVLDGVVKVYFVFESNDKPLHLKKYSEQNLIINW